MVRQLIFLTTHYSNFKNHEDSLLDSYVENVRGMDAELKSTRMYSRRFVE